MPDVKSPFRTMDFGSKFALEKTIASNRAAITSNQYIPSSNKSTVSNQTSPVAPNAQNSAVGSPPVYALSLNSIGNKLVDELSSLSFTVKSTQSGGGVVSYSCNNLPSGATFSTSTGAFTWSTGHDDIGTYTMTFTVHGWDTSDSETVDIVVNGIPVLDPIGNKSTSKDLILMFTVTATDPDGDDLTFDIMSGAPPGSTFVNGLFTYDPGGSVSGPYSTKFRVTDEHGATDSETITITVMP